MIKILIKWNKETLNLNVDPLAPKPAAKKETPAKKPAEPKVKTNKEKTKKTNEQKDDSFKPNLETKTVKEDSDLNKSEMEKVSDIDIEKIKEKLKK